MNLIESLRIRILRNFQNCSGRNLDLHLKLRFLKNLLDLADNAINIGSSCSVLFQSTTGLCPARRKILEHEAQSIAGNNPGVL